MKINPSTIIATWFGCGLLPKAPGTWGSLGALPVGLLIYVFAGTYGLITGIVLVSVIGWWAADKYDRQTNSTDNQAIVVDEVAGQWIVLLGAGLNPLLIFLAFVLFRFFDVTKIWPVSRFEKLPGAYGVMADDIVAGFYGLICLIGLHYAGLG
jgi:phosphatidylglycerophosphatase A